MIDYKASVQAVAQREIASLPAGRATTTQNGAGAGFGLFLAAIGVSLLMTGGKVKGLKLRMPRY